MAFFRDYCVVAALMFRTNGMPRLQGCKRAVVRLHRQAMRPLCAQARLVLTKKSSSGVNVYA